MTARWMPHAVTLLAAVSVVALLSGCSASVPAEQPTPAPTVDASPEPVASETPAPDEPSDVLFTISANVRSTEGTTIGISLTGHAPVAAKDDDVETQQLVDEFLEQCRNGIVGRTITPEDMVSNGSTLVSLALTSTRPGEQFASPLTLYLGSGYSAKAASGTGITSPSTASGGGCIGDYEWHTSGDGHGIAEFENGSPEPDMAMWRYGHYGFAVQFNSGDTIESCTIALSQLAKDAGIDDVPGWVSTDHTGTTCATGYVGE